MNALDKRDFPAKSRKKKKRKKKNKVFDFVKLEYLKKVLEFTELEYYLKLELVKLEY